MRTPFIFAVAILTVATLAAWGTVAAEIPPIKRVLPPEGLEIPADVRERLDSRLAATKKRMEAHKESLFLPDVEIFTKAVDLALIHREFYDPKDFAKADWALDEANKRLDSLDKGESPWTKTTGLVVRGYRSIIDDSAQPYGLVIPKDHDFDKACPLYVWLHGRGDKNTDLHFLQERATKPGQITTPPGAIVLHPFGRHCVGFKHAGEMEVLEATVSAKQHYKADLDHVVLIGFSMGGAGAWHLGAHYPWIWQAVSPGAGFAETARYQRLTPDKYPPIYEQRLWGQYDVPNYVRNLFNIKVIAYSGELDKQIQAARVMEEAYAAEGRQLTHLIGPGVEHKYEPKTLESLLGQLVDAASVEPERPLKQIHLQTQTLRYSRLGWIEVLRLDEHWKDSRVDAEITGKKDYRITTKNIAALALGPGIDLDICRVTIDGTELPIGSKIPVVLTKKGGKWEWDMSRWIWGGGVVDAKQLSKRPGLTGPIDDAFSGYDLNRSFLVIVPTGESKNAAFEAWQEFELNHFLTRWRALMRGNARVKLDSEVTLSDLESDQNLIVWGDPDSNEVMSKLIVDLPISFAHGQWKFGSSGFDGNRYIPAMIFPRKKANGEYSSYTVLNSGLTFREGHDRTNSLQNPKLPDWAIIDITQPPDAFAPGRIHDAGFFDEEWKLKGPVKGP